MSVIPWPYRLLALSALGVALVGFGWIKGASHVQAQWDAAIQQQALQTVAVRERQAQAIVKVVTQYVDRIRVVRAKGDTIIKEVPVYVPGLVSSTGCGNWRMMAMVAERSRRCQR